MMLSSCRIFNEQVARTNSKASDSGNAASPKLEGYGVLMISNALGAAEAIALEKVWRSRRFRRQLGRKALG